MPWYWLGGGGWTLVSDDMLVLFPTQAKMNRGLSLSRVVHKYGHKRVDFPGVCGPPEGIGYLVRSYSRLALWYQWYGTHPHAHSDCNLTTPTYPRDTMSS